MCSNISCIHLKKSSLKDRKMDGFDLLRPTTKSKKQPINRKTKEKRSTTWKQYKIRTKSFEIQKSNKA